MNVYKIRNKKNGSYATFNGQGVCGFTKTGKPMYSLKKVKEVIETDNTRLKVLTTCEWEVVKFAEVEVIDL